MAAFKECSTGECPSGLANVQTVDVFVSAGCTYWVCGCRGRAGRSGSRGLRRRQEEMDLDEPLEEGSRKRRRRGES